MKMSRNIVRRLELRIQHALTAEQIKKESVLKQPSIKSSGEDPLTAK